ncbi:MAG TPA: hypothetical protein VK824_10900 [Planctomycetota bacterium]|nr:hypothetical protein [Planctomycetota bacterium]
MAAFDTFSIGTVESLARAFAVGLRRQLAPKALATIDEANAGSDEVCASHEWLDASDVMDSAFMAVMHRAFYVDNEADMALWQAAWRHARMVGFAVLAREAGSR